MENYLPPIEFNEDDPERTDAYRQLGMMALLDIDYWQGESEMPIGEYFETLVGRLKSGNVLLAIDDRNRAIGYLAWQKDPTSNQSITITHQSAPFGDHLELFERLKKQFPEIEMAKSRNLRSAREEQVAW